MNTVQISQIIEDTGEKSRTIQNWSDLGILRAEPSTDRRGRGTHRIYSAGPFYGERMWALFASALYRLRMPLRDMKELVDAMRDVAAMDHSELTDHGLFPFYEVIGYGDQWLVHIAIKDEDDPDRGRGIHFTKAEWLVRGGEKARQLNDFLSRNPVTVTLNLFEVFKVLREDATGLVAPEMERVGPSKIEELLQELRAANA